MTAEVVKTVDMHTGGEASFRAGAGDPLGGGFVLR